MTREQLNQDKRKKVLNEQRNERRKKITIFIFKLAFFIIVFFLFFYLYTTFISTRILSINEYQIINEKIPDSFNGLKIVHFSDLHYGTTVFNSELKEMVDEINIRKPDIVVFTGDLIDSKYVLNNSEQEEIIKALEKIDATLGKYAISGEEDVDSFFTIMKQSNFEIINNSYEFIYKDDYIPIILVGLDSYINEKDNIAEAFKFYDEQNYNSNLFSITILHEPDNIDNVKANYFSDVFLAGHSHNGTIRIPFIGGVYKYYGANKYVDSHYTIASSDIYISGGIGTNGPGFRLFCRPSINFFRISNK